MDERWPTGRTRDGQFRREAKMPEDPADHRRLLDERDEPQPAATSSART
jgi:hypothetical protein